MEKSPWRKALKPFEGSVLKKSLGQLILTLFLYIFMITAMVMLIQAEVKYWIILLMSIPTAGLQVRIFIIMHDCGHQSYFKSTKVNNNIGRLCGLLTFTPYYDWRHSHAIHHATVSNLEKRGDGDIWTLKVIVPLSVG